MDSFVWTGEKDKRSSNCRDDLKGKFSMRVSVRVHVCGSACVSACACAHVFSHASVYALALAIVRSSMYWLLISIAIFFFLRMVIWYSTSLDCGIITQLEVPELNFPIINKSWRVRTERFRKKWLTFIFYNNVDMRRYNVWRKKKVTHFTCMYEFSIGIQIAISGAVTSWEPKLGSSWR